MQKYLDQAKKTIKKRYTSKFQTNLAQMNVLSTIMKKGELNNQHHFQTQNKYSSIYLDNPQLDQQKKLSFLTKFEGFQKIKNFLEKIEFDKIANTTEICSLSFNADQQCCFINLDIILEAENRKRFFIVHPNGLDKKQFLNQGIDEISLVLLEYFKGLYYSQQISEEFIISYQEIQDFIYKSVRSQAKKASQNIYKQLQYPLDQIYKSLISNNTSLEILTQQIYCQGVQLIELKSLIEQFFKDRFAIFQDEIKINYKFPISQVIIAPYITKLQNYYLKVIMDSFRTYVTVDNKIYYKKIVARIKRTFAQYLQKQQFFGGIQHYQINQNLQYLIYSIDWESSEVSELGIEILNQLTQDHEHVFKKKDLITFQGKQLTVEILFNFKEYHKQECDDAKQWWYSYVNEELNIKVICQLYLLLARICFINQKIYFGQYEPANRIALTMILRVLNNGKHHYLNQTILKFCEKLTFKIQAQIYNQIDQNIDLIKRGQIAESILADPLIIKLQGQFINVWLFQGNQNSIQSAKFFHEKNTFLFQILQNHENIHQMKEKQTYFLQPKLSQIQIQHSDILGHSVQENIKFEVLSQAKSNVVTLAISGFLSGDYDKQNYWKGLLRQGCGTVVALHWNCGQPIDFAKYIANKVIPKFSPQKDIPKIVESSFDTFKYNIYKCAHDEAVRVGKYLAFLIAEHSLFGDCQINLVVHSLGSVILLECIKILDKLFSTNRKQIINQILILGGVVDVNKLRERKWNSVAGRIYNIYSKKDYVLMVILKLATLFDVPCGILIRYFVGLQQINLGYKPVINCDFTDIVDGHFDYKNQLDRILIQSDFNNDFKYMTSEITGQL